MELRLSRILGHNFAFVLLHICEKEWFFLHSFLFSLVLSKKISCFVFIPFPTLCSSNLTDFLFPADQHSVEFQCRWGLPLSRRDPGRTQLLPWRIATALWYKYFFYLCLEMMMLSIAGQIIVPTQHLCVSSCPWTKSNNKAIVFAWILPVTVTMAWSGIKNIKIQ